MAYKNFIVKNGLTTGTTNVFDSSGNLIASSSAGSYANSAYIHANAAYAAANSAGGADTWARNTANAASSYANSAYSKANTGITGITITNETSSSSTYYPLFTTASSGTIGVANTSSSKLSFVPSTGTLTVTDLNTTSDSQYKENVVTITNPIDILNRINGVSFNWKESNNKSYGVIAQELQQVLPELVKQGDTGLSVSYIPLIAILIQAIKEQQKQIEELKSRV